MLNEKHNPLISFTLVIMNLEPSLPIVFYSKKLMKPRTHWRFAFNEA